MITLIFGGLFSLLCVGGYILALEVNHKYLALWTYCAAACVAVVGTCWAIQDSMLEKDKSANKVRQHALLNEDGQALTTEDSAMPAKPESKPAAPENTNSPTEPIPPKTEPAKAAPTSGASSGLLPSQIIAMHAADSFSFMSTGSGGIKSTMQYANEGDSVGWTLYLLDVTSFWGPFGDSDLKVRCTEQPMDTTAVVVFNVPLFAHEYLRVSIDRYQMFSVVGTIAHIGSSEILLKDAIMEPITDGL